MRGGGCEGSPRGARGRGDGLLFGTPAVATGVPPERSPPPEGTRRSDARAGGVVPYIIQPAFREVAMEEIEVEIVLEALPDVPRIYKAAAKNAQEASKKKIEWAFQCR